MVTQPTKLEPIRYSVSLMILQMVAGEKHIFLFSLKICCGNEVLRIGLPLSTSAAVLKPELCMPFLCSELQ